MNGRVATGEAVSTCTLAALRSAAERYAQPRRDRPPTGKPEHTTIARQARNRAEWRHPFRAIDCAPSNAAGAARRGDRDAHAFLAALHAGRPNGAAFLRAALAGFWHGDRAPFAWAVDAATERRLRRAREAIERVVRARTGLPDPAHTPPPAARREALLRATCTAAPNAPALALACSAATSHL